MADADEVAVSVPKKPEVSHDAEAPPADISPEKSSEADGTMTSAAAGTEPEESGSSGAEPKAAE